MVHPEDLPDPDLAANRREVRNAVVITVVALAAVLVASVLIVIGGIVS